MKSILRVVGLLLSLIVISCGGGDVQRGELLENDRKTTQSTDDCQQLTTIVFGAGTETEITDSPVPEPPDFVTKRSWLETPWGVETYQYGQTETLKMKGRFENIGDGPCLPTDTTQTIIVHAYLSKGYKEDAHSDWKLVGTDEIQCDNLKPGDTHTETEGLILSNLEPGIHNIVWCIDHPRTDHNEGGNHREKHESNNCSTEAVFEVIAGTVNVPNVDIVSTGFALLQDPVYAAGQIRLGAWVKNQGSMDALTGIRSTYTASCNGGPAVLLADDGTDMEELRAGGSVWEEIQTAVTMPDVVGTCIITFTVDTGNVQSETDETNNTATLSVTLAPRPLPDFIITYVGIGDSNDTSIKKGSEKHPTMRIKNVGSGPAISNIYNYYYWCTASLQCSFIDGDNTEASLLCVGCEAKERIDRSWSASQRGTFYLKVCTDVNEQQPELDETNNCRFSSPITVK